MKKNEPKKTGKKSNLCKCGRANPTVKTLLQSIEIKLDRIEGLLIELYNQQQV